MANWTQVRYGQGIRSGGALLQRLVGTVRCQPLLYLLFSPIKAWQASKKATTVNQVAEAKEAPAHNGVIIVLDRTCIRAEFLIMQQCQFQV